MGRVAVKRLSSIETSAPKSAIFVVGACSFDVSNSNPSVAQTILNISTADCIASAVSTIKTSPTYNEITTWIRVAIIHFSNIATLDQLVGALRDPNGWPPSVAILSAPVGGANSTVANSFCSSWIGTCLYACANYGHGLTHVLL